MWKRSDNFDRVYLRNSISISVIEEKVEGVCEERYSECDHYDIDHEKISIQMLNIYINREKIQKIEYNHSLHEEN